MKRKISGFTLIEVLFATFLISLLFLVIIGGYILGMKINSLLMRKVTATQLAVGEMEKIKTLPYLKVGTKNATLPFASGDLEPESFVKINNFQYKIQRRVKFISDPLDGEESCPLDYKKVEIRVFFGTKEKDFVSLVSNIFPRTKVEELQVCQEQPAGVLMVQIFNSKGDLISNPKIEIFHAQTKMKIDEASPSTGIYYFPLAAGEYIVKASKEGYSFERTYGIDEIPKPQKPNPRVFIGESSKISLSIDKLSSMEIQTLSMWSEDYFLDTFLDENKISEKESIVLEEGNARLATSTQGYLFSVEISHPQLKQWGTFSFLSEKPPGTDLKFQFYFASGTEWLLVPDEDLPGNFQGFEESPIDLSRLSVPVYSRLKIKANFFSQDPNFSPLLKEYQLSFRTSFSLPIPNVSFNLRGEKILGEDQQENPVFKFSTSTFTNHEGKLVLEKLEWDIYHFSDFKIGFLPLQLATSSPSHPVSLLPETREKVNLYLRGENTLLVTVLDEDTLLPIFSAEVLIEKDGFSLTQYTNNRGQTFFIVPERGTFSLSISASGYFSTSTRVFVSGETSKIVKIKIAD